MKEIFENNIKILDHYGVKAQIPVWIEEMSELIKVLCKWSRKYDELEGDITGEILSNMQEEIADVTICMDQLKYIIRYTEDELMEEYKYKVNRQLQRIENDNT